MRAIIALLLALFATPTLAQQMPWWGGSATGTGYPTNSTPVTSSATGSNAAVSATLPGVAGKATFICGVVLTSNDAATANYVTATITGTVSGTLNFIYVFPAAGEAELIVVFPICIPANAMNTPIVVTLPAGGTGTTAAVTAWGYQL